MLRRIQTQEMCLLFSLEHFNSMLWLPICSIIQHKKNCAHSTKMHSTSTKIHSTSTKNHLTSTKNHSTSTKIHSTSTKTIQLQQKFIQLQQKPFNFNKKTFNFNKSFNFNNNIVSINAMKIKTKNKFYNRFNILIF